MINKKSKFVILVLVFLALIGILGFLFKNYQESSTPISTKTSQDDIANSLIKNLRETNEYLLYQNVEFLKKNSDLLETNQYLEDNFSKQEDSLQHTPKITNPLKEESQKNLAEVSSNHKNLIGNCKRIRPQLAIIIDDIAFIRQYHKVMQLPFKVTPSIFPKGKASPNTPNIAKTAPFYMVHLPLEALSFYQKGHDLLLNTDSKETIQKKIKTLKEDFPDLTYINNHTGSKFTQNETLMKFLLEALEQEGITFVDSRTIAGSVTRKYYQYHPKPSFNACQNTPFLERDVFLDNELDIQKITANLMKAIKIAKTKGYAIAIGHPHKETLLALQNASGYLKESGVDLVYVNELIVP
ncbi:divergent polysaccharide deacetylase family protein [Helicobacter mesocricetorum]|uniref:divergent polysaccharide deacetylase family protein n=1 Tax=Helicobacter mesocricetorum TaxID=87012 RepID=UPI000CF03AB4|nr:divergent polysaccharide deacetylase family protein [Helicobacter mesocricetorum]